MKWAQNAGIPLVPRAKATSGYGGVIPVRGGVVVDFYRMKNVLSIDAAAGTVTVEPAITWEKLDQALKPDGLTLRLYPTSYPSSSVGGWLAQGGAGIGSYEFGWFKENVVSARIVLPGGEARDLSRSGSRPRVRRRGHDRVHQPSDPQGEEARGSRPHRHRLSGRP